MLPKPKSCLGCPLYGDGQGFVPDHIVPGATVAVLAQNPGEGEERGQMVTGYEGKQAVTVPSSPAPLIGPTGYQLTKTFLPLAGLDRESVSLCNVIKCRLQTPAGRVNTLPKGRVLEAAVAHCTQAHLRVPESTQLIVAMGALAWRHLEGPGSITDWRGYLAPSDPSLTPIYATLHLADLLHDPKMNIVTRMDYAKIPRILRGEWPKPIPPRRSYGGQYDAEANKWFKLAHDAPFVAVDTEFNKDTKDLVLVGLGFPGMPYVLQCEWNNIRGGFGILFSLLTAHVPMVFQNALADIPVIRQAMGLDWGDYKSIEDTMQAHAVLWSELPHTLEFLASIYGQYPKLKHLQHQNPLLYNEGDVLETISVWEAEDAEFARDPDSRKVYRTQLRLLPHIDESTTIGIRTDPEKVYTAQVEYGKKVEIAQAMAEAYCGYPINLNSDDQLRRWLYEIEGFSIQKHRKTKQPTVDKDAVAVLSAKFLPTDGTDETSVDRTLERIQEGGHPLLEARMLHGNAAQCISHYLTPLLQDGTCVPRIHHHINLHAQANARWSYTDPPLAQLPRDLRGLYRPDSGWPWLQWDHDQIELRLVAAYSQDQTLLEAFEKGWDVHALAAYEMFGLPHPPQLCDPVHALENEAWRTEVNWKRCDHAQDVCGKDDLRRHFAKTFGHRQSYGGTAGRSGNIPGAKQLGLTSPQLMRMSHARSALFPRLIQWQNQIVVVGLRSGETRNWYGRRRRYLGREGTYTKGEMLDHPMQSGVQDIENLIILEIKERFGRDAIYKYGMHDSQIWGIRESKWDEITPQIRLIVQRPREINGCLMKLPASFKERRA